MIRYALLLCTMVSLGARAQCLDDFTPAMQTDQNIYQEYEGAVLHLTAGSEQGTGFLIDSARGYVLTAAHVTTGAAAITATTTARPNTTLKLKRVLDLTSTGVDTALLQLDPPASLLTVRPLDVATDAPRRGATVYTMGYPKVLDRGIVTIKDHTGQVQGVLDQKRRLLIDVPSFDGDSGSPIIDAYGNVAAIAVEIITSSTIAAIPMAKLLETIETLPASDRITALDGQVRTNTIPHDDLVQDLIPRSTSCMNTELLSWAGLMQKQPDKYAKAQAYFDCPIIRAFEQRHLDDALVLVRSIVPPSVAGRALLHVGVRSRDLGDVQLATQQLNDANVTLVNALKEHVRINPSGLTFGLCRASPLTPTTDTVAITFTNASLTVHPSECADAHADAATFDLLQDFALTQQARASILSGTEHDAALHDAVAAAKLATWASATADQRGAGYATLGDALHLQHDENNAAAAYATAHQLGLHEPRIANSWKLSAQRAINEHTAPFDILTKGINDAPTLGKVDLTNAVPMTAIKPEILQ